MEIYHPHVYYEQPDDKPDVIRRLLMGSFLFDVNGGGCTRCFSCSFGSIRFVMADTLAGSERV